VPFALLAGVLVVGEACGDSGSCGPMLACASRVRGVVSGSNSMFTGPLLGGCWGMKLKRQVLASRIRADAGKGRGMLLNDGELLGPAFGCKTRWPLPPRMWAGRLSHCCCQAPRCFHMKNPHSRRPACDWGRLLDEKACRIGILTGETRGTKLAGRGMRYVRAATIGHSYWT